ncbi:hypothetical protein [Nocardia nepalensis]|uniref:hypothetical protein n=1 Tax=Nocardia nepalensis TaxID=3375448 RepID=UPI003B675C9C
MPMQQDSAVNTHAVKRSSLRRHLVVAAVALAVVPMSVAVAPTASAQEDAVLTTLSFEGLDRPQGVAVNAAGDVFVADTGNNRVLKLRPSGLQVQLPFTGLDSPQAVAVNTAGDVFVADTGNGRVLKLEAGTSTQTVLPAMYDDYYDDTHRYTNRRPIGLAVDVGGDLLVLDDGIGRVVRIPVGADVGIGLPLKVVTPGGIAVDSAGTVYVSYGGHSGDDAHVVKLPAGASAGIDLPFRFFGVIYRGIGVDSAGDVLTAEYWSGTVWRLSAGKDAPTREPFTDLAEPAGLAIDNLGDVYVADTANNRIVKLTYPCVGWLCALRGLQLYFPPELRPCLFLPLLCNPCGPFGLCLPPELRGR